MNSDSTTPDSPRMSVDAGSDDRQEPQFGEVLYDFTAGGDEEVCFLLSLSGTCCSCHSSYHESHQESMAHCT